MEPLNTLFIGITREGSSLTSIMLDLRFHGND